MALGLFPFFPSEKAASIPLAAFSYAMMQGQLLSVAITCKHGLRLCRRSNECSGKNSKERPIATAPIFFVCYFPPVGVYITFSPCGYKLPDELRFCKSGKIITLLTATLYWRPARPSGRRCGVPSPHTRSAHAECRQGPSILGRTMHKPALSLWITQWKTC